MQSYLRYLRQQINIEQSTINFYLYILTLKKTQVDNYRNKLRHFIAEIN